MDNVKTATKIVIQNRLVRFNVSITLGLCLGFRIKTGLGLHWV